MAIELWPFAGNLGMDAAAQHRGGVGVVQIHAWWVDSITRITLE